jgi:iron complex outermembrane recepter protein
MVLGKRSMFQRTGMLYGVAFMVCHGRGANKVTPMLLFILVVLVNILLPLVASPAAAEENKQTVKADDMVVTATRTEINVDEAPASVTVLTKEDIKKTNTTTLVDALKHIGGAFVNTSSTGSVSMRGLNGENRTLVMVNGLPVNDGYSGGSGWNTMGIDDVERIEITRGAGSALYGGNAMGGVINIVTAKPEKREGEISTKFGSDKTFQYSAYAGDRIDRFRVRLGYEALTSDGYPINLVSRTPSSGTGTLNGGYATTDNYGNPRWICGDTGDAEKESSSLSMMASYDFTDTGSLTLDFQRGKDDRNYDRPNTYLTDSLGYPSFSGSARVATGRRASVTPVNYLSSPYNMENYLTSLTYKEKFGSVDFTAKGGYRTTDSLYTTASSGTYDNASGTRTDYGTESWLSDVQADIPLGSQHLLTSGITFRLDSAQLDTYNVGFYRDENSVLSKRDTTEGRTRFLAFYLQDAWTVIDQVTVYGGARIDTWNAYDGKSGTVGREGAFEELDDSEISPHLATVWKPLADTFVRGSIAHSFRPPTVYELYRVSTMGSYTYNNNPNLKPETSWTYEIGADQYLLQRSLKLSTTGFFTQAEDLISSYIVGTNQYKENIGEAEIKGIELGLSYQPLEWLGLWANYSLADSEVIKNDRNPSAEGKRLTYYPDHTFNSGFDLTFGSVKASLAGNYTGRIYLSDMNDDLEGMYGSYSKRWVWDAKITFSPVSYAECSFYVNNVFDEESFIASMVGPERMYFLELTFKF